MATYLGVVQRDSFHVSGKVMMRSARKSTYHVFVSYSYDDLEIVEDIVRLLDHIGMRLWFDRSLVRFGQLRQEIRTGIDESECFAFFLSCNTGKSQWLEHEAAYFRQSRATAEPLPFILAKLSEGELPPSIADLTPRIVHYIDFHESFIDGLVKFAGIFAADSIGILDKIGILRYYGFRGEVPPYVWDMLNARANREIKLLGHSMTPAFADGRDRKLVLPALRDRRVKMRVMLLTPNVPRLQQLEEVQQGLKQRTDLLEKIHRTIAHIRELKRDLRDAGPMSQLQVRITDRIIYSSASIFDSIALITNYTTREDIGNSSPTFLVCPTEPERGGLFAFYNEEFERYWEDGVHPEEERRKTDFDDSTRILKHGTRVSQIARWFAGDMKTLPPPSMLVIFPTYECWWEDRGRNRKYLCENCIYREKRDRKHIEFDLLSSIIYQAVFELGIHNIEFSGGGEPLQYQDIESLLRLLRKVKDENEEAKFGLLTNGLHLNKELVSLAASVFSYIRFSYAEGIQANEEAKADFTTNLAALLEYVQDSSGSPRIGLKLLVSKQNVGTLVNELLDLKENLGRLFQRVDHIRVKAMRSPRSLQFEPDTYDSLRFRNEFYDYIFTYQEDWPEDIQVDLDLRYVASDFRCRLSPLSAVIDPAGSLLVCWNYLRDYQKLQIGNLHSKRMKDLWGSRRHHRAATKVNPQTVCNAKNGCPCRFVRYQEVMDNPDQYEQRYLPNGINGFL